MTSRKRNWWFSENGDSHGGWQRIEESDSDPTFDAVANREVDDPPLDLWKALSKLTEPQRFVIHLRYGLGGCSVTPLEDIAGMMNISNQAVSRLEQRALQRLRGGLEEIPRVDVFEQCRPEDEEEAGGTSLDVQV